jgi:glucose/arabinose dehydrogenase
MPVLADLGPAAPCGLAVARSNALGLRNKALSCQFNLRRVQAHTMQPSGSALSATTTDVIVSDFQDFHPTDVVEDADGSLLVVDTGGWYKLCCPSSQMVKAEALGAIYRIEKTDGYKSDFHKSKYKIPRKPSRIKIEKSGTNLNSGFAFFW